MSNTTSFPRALPEIRPFIASLPVGGIDYSTDTINKRPAFPALPLPDPKLVSIENIYVDIGDGKKLRLLVLKPLGSTSSPAVVTFHGGGFLLGAPEMDLSLLNHFAENGIAVVSVDYRLAPEHVFPSASDDADTAWSYVISHGEALGINIERIALWGCSVGAALATGLAIRLKDRGASVQPKLVVLDSPCIDDRLIYPEQQPGYHHLEPYYAFWTTKNVQDMKLYLGTSDIPVDAMPLRASVSELRGLPPHYISASELDSIVRHGTDYSAKLHDADVPTELHVWRGTTHSFIGVQPQTAIAARAREEYLRVIRDVLVEGAV